MIIIDYLLKNDPACSQIRTPICMFRPMPIIYFYNLFCMALYLIERISTAFDEKLIEVFLTNVPTKKDR
ncbi:MAG: hypothetical protein ACPG8W_21790, partial [Candidatus Promineifilaceae bacterium]